MKKKLAIFVLIAFLAGAGVSYLALEKPWKSGVSKTVTSEAVFANNTRKDLRLDSKVKIGPSFGDKTLKKVELNQVIHAMGVGKAYARASTWIVDKSEDLVILPPKESPIKIPVCKRTPIRVPVPIEKIRKLPDGRYDFEMQIAAYLYTGSKKAVVQAKRRGIGTPIEKPGEPEERPGVPEKPEKPEKPIPEPIKPWPPEKKKPPRFGVPEPWLPHPKPPEKEWPGSVKKVSDEYSFTVIVKGGKVSFVFPPAKRKFWAM